MEDSRKNWRPISPVGGYSFRGPDPSCLLTDLPPSFPEELQPTTRVILRDAVQKFPLRTQLVPLCSYVVGELTQHFVGMVERGKLKAHAVDGHIRELVRYVLIENQERDWYRLIQEEIQLSKEWQELDRKFAEMVSARASESPREVSEDYVTVRSQAPFQSETSPQSHSRESVLRKLQNSQCTVLTTPEVAAYFKVTRRTVYRWNRQGKLRDGAKRGTFTIASIKKFERERGKPRKSQKDL